MGVLMDLSQVGKHCETKADSTLNNMKKADLIEYIRMLEHIIMAVKKNAEVNTENENVEVTETVEKEAVNVLDLLLGSDLGTIKQPYKDVEITRLSEALGAPFVVRCEALTPDTYEDVQENAITIKGKDVDLDMNTLQMLTVIEGVKATAVDENGNRVAAGLLLKNKDLLSRFKAPTPKELCRKLFLSGEVANMYNAITKLSGFSETAVKELKN